MNHVEYKIGEIVSLSQGQVINAKTNYLVVEKGLPLLRIGDMINSRQEIFIDETKVPKKNIAKKEDIIFTRTGQVGLVFRNQFGVVHNNCFKVIPNKELLSPDYLYWYLRAPRTYKHVQQLSGGAAQPDLPHGAFNMLEISLPNLPTQQKIASILSAYDDLIENNNKRIQLLEEMAEEIYKEWFVRMRFPGYQDCKYFDKDGKEVPQGTYGALPEGWQKSQLKHHIEFFRGKSYLSAELRDNEGLAMLNLKNIKRQGGFRLDGLKYFEGKHSVNNEARVGDIIMAVTDMTQEREIVGRVARVPDMGIEKFIISMDLIRIEPLKLPKLYLYCFFRFSGIGFQLKEFANGANVLHLTPSLIEFQKAIVPDIDTCRQFEKIIKPMISEIDVLNNKNQLLQETIDLLLPRLISGKLSVEDLDIRNESLPMAAEPNPQYNN